MDGEWMDKWIDGVIVVIIVMMVDEWMMIDRTHPCLLQLQDRRHHTHLQLPFQILRQ